MQGVRGHKMSRLPTSNKGGAKTYTCKKGAGE